jgi:hypothetical protein
MKDLVTEWVVEREPCRYPFFGVHVYISTYDYSVRHAVLVENLCNTHIQCWTRKINWPHILVPFLFCG